VHSQVSFQEVTDEIARLSNCSSQITIMMLSSLFVFSLCCKTEMGAKQRLAEKSKKWTSPAVFPALFKVNSLLFALEQGSERGRR
jgi:hypothetical protein